MVTRFLVCAQLGPRQPKAPTPSEGAGQTGRNYAHRVRSASHHFGQACRIWALAWHDCDSGNGQTQLKKADRLNADLAAAGAITKLDQKNITAWLDLRNKAAHGKYAEYQKQQVAIQIDGIRDFIVRVPA